MSRTVELPRPGFWILSAPAGFTIAWAAKTKLMFCVRAVELMPLPEKVDRQFLLQVLVARESLGSTAVGKGIALPHVRNPVVMHIDRPMITLCFLENAV